jgi:hypothetical protein
MAQALAMAALGLAPAPVAVVSLQFCTPRTVPLTVTKMAMSFSGGDFIVTGATGAVVLRVEGVCFSVGRRRVLHDAGGRPILTMQEKVNCKYTNTQRIRRAGIYLTITFYNPFLFFCGHDLILLYYIQ